MEDNVSGVYHSPIGNISIEIKDDAITRLVFIDDEEKVENITMATSSVLKECIKQLDEYFSGKRKNFELPVNTEGTDFQKKIWEILLSIDYGKTISYLELSKLFGNEKAIRAIAAANGKNAVALIIPCHRVIGNDGKMVGYAGKIWRKKWLLEHEGAIVNSQQSLFPLYLI